MTQIKFRKGETLNIRVQATKFPGCNHHVDLIHEGKKVTFSTYAVGRTKKEAVDRAVQNLRRSFWFPVLKRHGVKFQLKGPGLQGHNIRKKF